MNIPTTLEKLGLLIDLLAGAKQKRCQQFFIFSIIIDFARVGAITLNPGENNLVGTVIDTLSPSLSNLTGTPFGAAGGNELYLPLIKR